MLQEEDITKSTKQLDVKKKPIYICKVYILKKVPELSRKREAYIVTVSGNAYLINQLI